MLQSASAVIERVKLCKAGFSDSDGGQWFYSKKGEKNFFGNLESKCYSSDGMLATMSLVSVGTESEYCFKECALNIASPTVFHHYP